MRARSGQSVPKRVIECQPITAENGRKLEVLGVFGLPKCAKNLGYTFLDLAFGRRVADLCDEPVLEPPDHFGLCRAGQDQTSRIGGIAPSNRGGRIGRWVHHGILSLGRDSPCAASSRSL